MSVPIDNEAFRNLLLSWPEKALAYLYDQYYEDLLKTADLYTRSRNLSEDAVQDVLVDIFKKHKILGLQRDQPFLAYLFKAVANQAISSYKRTIRANIRETTYFYLTESLSGERNPETDIIASEKRSFLKVILGTLTPREKECLLMQVEEKLSVKEIAQRLGISVKGVERNLTSARKRLRKFRAIM